MAVIKRKGDHMIDLLNKLFKFDYFVGCGILYVADGNWKLKYPHCMWKVPVNVDGFQNAINYPCICPLSPVRGQAFCKDHCELARRVSIPHELHNFLKFCGISGISAKFYFVHLPHFQPFQFGKILITSKEKPLVLNEARSIHDQTIVV